MSSSEVPVLIVGGGSAGTMLSLELARRGVEARTVDRLDEPARTSKAIAFHARTAEIVERIDKRLIQRFLDNGIAGKGYVLHFVDAEGRRSEVRPGIDFTTINSRYPYILCHGQSDTERFLREYMQDEFGREIEWSRHCTDVQQDQDGITATIVHTDDGGSEELVRCRYLVACDGINSRVRRCLGLEQEESDYAGTVLQNMDVYLNDFPDVEDYFHYCAGTDHFIMVCKLPGGFFRLLLSDRGEAADPNVSPALGFQRLLDKHFDGVTLGELIWHSKWESWVRLANTYREGNIFLAGDSAHVHSTTGGQGMNCCMQDAYNLGWKLGLVLNGQAKPELLDSYESERKPIAEQVIWAASSLHEIFMGHGKDIAERAKKISDPEFLDAVVGRCSGIAYTYRDYIAQPQGLQPIEGPVVGDRAPDATLADGQTLFDLTRHTSFTLLVVSSAQLAASEPGLERLQKQFSNLVRIARITLTPSLRESYGGGDEPRLFLIRPDGYIGYRCLLAEVDRLQSHLTELLTV